MRKKTITCTSTRNVFFKKIATSKFCVCYDLLFAPFFFSFLLHCGDDLRFNSFLFKKVHHHVGCTVCTATDIAFTTQFYFIQVYLNNNCNIWFMHSPSIASLKTSNNCN